MNITITINTDNAAFDESISLELIDVLNALAEKLKHKNLFDIAIIRDSNGNRVGKFEVSE